MVSAPSVFDNSQRGVGIAGPFIFTFLGSTLKFLGPDLIAATNTSPFCSKWLML